MFNFLRRSKTKDHIEYNKNDLPKEKFKKLCQELDVANAPTDNNTAKLLLAASASCPNKNTTEVAPPKNDVRKTIESGKQRSATLTSLPLLNVNEEGNVIFNNPPSLTTSITSTDRRFINPNPYVANICDLVYLTNDAKQKKIGDTFKDMMAPAMGWRNKNKNSKKGKNKNQTINNSPLSVMGNASGTQNTQQISGKGVTKVRKNENLSEQLKNKDSGTTINNKTNISKCNNDSTSETTSQINTPTSVEERPVKPPRVEKNNSILRTSTQVHTNTNANSQQQRPNDGNIASKINTPQSPNNAVFVDRKTSNSSEFENDTLEVFLPPDITVTEIESKNSPSISTKQNSTSICATSENFDEKQKSSENSNSLNNRQTEINKVDSANSTNTTKNLVNYVNQNSNNFSNKENDVSTKPIEQKPSRNKNIKKNIMGNQKSVVDSKIMKINVNQSEEQTNKMNESVSNVPKVNQSSTMISEITQGTNAKKESINKSNEENTRTEKKPEIEKTSIIENGADPVKILIAEASLEKLEAEKIPQNTNTPQIAFTKIINGENAEINNQILEELESTQQKLKSSELKIENKEVLTCKETTNQNLENLSEKSENTVVTENKKENNKNESEITKSTPNSNINRNDSTSLTVDKKVNGNFNNAKIKIYKPENVNSISVPSINNCVTNDNDHSKSDQQKFIKSDTTAVTINSESITIPQKLAVCSIAIPLPQKITKSEKIPVTSTIDPTTTSPIQNNDFKNDEKVSNKNNNQPSVQNNGPVNKINKNQQIDQKKEPPISNAKKMEMRNLVNQEERLKAQIIELKKQLNERDTEAIKLKYDMDELQRDVYVKSSGMDRLQAELTAANKESEYVRQRLRHVEDELQSFRDKNGELAEELSKKSEEIATLQQSNEKQVADLEQKIKELTEKIQELENQNEEIKKERDRLENQRLTLEKEREEEKKLIQETLDTALAEKKQIQERWERDFEKLRTVNTDREQQLLDDFEWKLREVEQTCKKRLEEKDRKAEEKIKQAYKDIEEKVKNAEAQLNEALRLKSYEAEVKQLRGLTDDQQKSLRVMVQKTEELQLTEETLKKEIEKLKRQIEAEKGKIILLNHEHEQALTAKERELLVKLETQRGEIAVQWEERLHQECARLKSELEQIHNEEKLFAIEAIKRNKEEEFDEQRKEWERRLEDCNQQITKLKNEISQKEETYIRKIEQIQTNADRDMMELRRNLDKTDMTYSNQIEKLTENHEREIERLTDEYEKKIKELETNWQMQIASTRTTLELVKEQMERDAQDRLQELDQHHQNQLKLQWEQLIQDKEEALQQMEQKYRINSEKLKEEIANLQKSHTEKEMELLTFIENLKTQLDEKNSQINCLQSNVDTLQGGIHVLNREIKNHGDEIIKMQKDCDSKIRSLKDSLLAEQIRRINQQKEQHKIEINKIEQNARNYIEKLQKKYLCLTKLFEEMRVKYKEKDVCIENNTKELNKLKQIIIAQENEIKRLTAENEKYKLQIEQCTSKEYQRKGGGVNNEHVITQGQDKKYHENSNKTPKTNCELITVTNSHEKIQENLHNSCN